MTQEPTRPFELTAARARLDDIGVSDGVAGANLAEELLDELVRVRADLAVNEHHDDGRLSIAEATIARLTGPEARERLGRRLYRWRCEEESVPATWETEPDSLRGRLARPGRRGAGGHLRDGGLR